VISSNPTKENKKKSNAERTAIVSEGHHPEGAGKSQSKSRGAPPSVASKKGVKGDLEVSSDGLGGGGGGGGGGNKKRDWYTRHQQ